MERSELLNLLCELNEGISDDYSFKEQIDETLSKLSQKCEEESLYENVCHIIDKNFSPEVKKEWDYIVISVTLLERLKTTLAESKEDVLSVQQTKDLRKYLRNLVNIGICAKLLPKLPLCIKSEVTYDGGDIFYNYNILKITILALCDFLKCPNLRLILLPDSLRPILVACYQIAFCPLKKPSLDLKGEHKNVITEEIYQKLSIEQNNFAHLLVKLRNSIHPLIFIKETMAVFYANTPVWFKKAVSQNLTSILLSKNGLEGIAIALLDGTANDSTHTWKTLDVISMLVLSCKSFPYFKENIGNQLVTLLSKVTETTLVYERVYIHCTKSLYKTEPELAKEVFVRPLVTFLLYFTYTSHRFQEKENITVRFRQIVRALRSLFVESNVDLKKLPINILTPVVDVLFRFFIYTSNSDFTSTNKEIKELLQAYLGSNLDQLFGIFDCFLFSIPSAKLLLMRKDVWVTTTEQEINVGLAKHSVTYSISDSSEALLEILKSKTDMRVKFFGFLLNCLVNKEKYFKKVNEELMNLEEEFMNEHLEKNLVVYNLLAGLAEDKNIQKRIKERPEEIISYIQNVLRKTIKLNTHKSLDADSEAYQSFFTVLMILQNLAVNCSKSNLDKYEKVIEPLRKIHEETPNGETHNIVADILEVLGKGKINSTSMFIEEKKSELDQAIEDICDPLLPIRGHGLMTLAKLVEKKDKNIMERKQYVLNIFQQNLKNEDSFIYLSAIGGLAALGDVFPDTVLNILCDEYSDCTKHNNDDGHEVRMKIGESLVRVTKTLGDVAPKYKPLLLNTFLNGVKDSDDLIRASSLSNLGEICRVLGYKLGTIVTEVLVCVHAIVSTDKSPQARRAAVTVLRQLFVGLESEMISFLKDEILPIYRTLRDIYNNDKDDVMRLQAQLALEELNKNVKNFVLPNPQLHTDKKIIMLN